MELIEKFRKATNKLVLLDYDGTLVNYALIPDNALPPENLLNVLIKLVDKPHTKVIIISGRGHREIDKLLGRLPISIIAEHGALVKENGLWGKQLIDNCLWKNVIIPLLNQVTLKCPESYIEEKCFSLTWHYRNAELSSGYAYSRELISLAEKFTGSYNLKILDGNKVVEIMPGEIGKGKAVKKIVEQDNYDYILSIGDDATDEEIFELFLPDANFFTVKVGNGSTFAKYRFDSVSDVVLFLKHLSE
ncbi:MAG: trehalose-phosphatase [Bacteroidota bacterium]